LERKRGFFHKREEVIVRKKKGIGCEFCPLNGKSNRLEPYGLGKKKVLIWGECPGKTEDMKKTPFCGECGSYFRSLFHDLDFYEDCIVVNTVDCRPWEGTIYKKRNRKPTNKEIECCFKRKKDILKKEKPKFILLVGGVALSTFLKYKFKERGGLNTNISSWRGKLIPDQELRAWVIPIYHPSFIFPRGTIGAEPFLKDDLRKFEYIVNMERPPKPIAKWNINWSTNIDVIINEIEKIDSSFCFDYETSCLSPKRKEDIIYVVSFSIDGKYAFVFPLDKTDKGKPYFNERQKRQIKEVWKNKLEDSNLPKEAWNMKFENKWSNHIGIKVNNWDWDGMIGAHILDSSHGTKSLKIQAYINYGIIYGEDISSYMGMSRGKNRMDNLSLEKICTYCGMDSIFTKRINNKQKRIFCV